jgi:hypothetical protein
LKGSSLLDEHRNFQVSDLVGRQPAGGQGWGINEQEKTQRSKDHRGDALDDEDPTPSFENRLAMRA